MNMGKKRTLAILILLALILPDTLPVHAEPTDGPMTPTGHSKRFNTNGVEFGSDVELGASGSTPGIILSRGDGSTPNASFRAQAAAADGNGASSWGLLGLLGLFGLSGLRSRNRRSV
jgi:hypothetical protein